MDFLNFMQISLFYQSLIKQCLIVNLQAEKTTLMLP